MRTLSARLALVLVTVLAFSCGTDKPKPKDGKKKPDAGAADTDSGADEQQVKSARDRIAEWLGDAATEKVQALGADLGAEIGAKLSSDPKVKEQITKLTKKILGEKKVKKELDKIADKATEGFMNKLTLGWKALKAGGVKEYKKKVKENTTKIATEVIEEWVREHLFKHERMAETMKKFLPVLKVQGKVAAVSVQENLSPEASKKILGIALNGGETRLNAPLQFEPLGLAGRLNSNHFGRHRLSGFGWRLRHLPRDRFCWFSRRFCLLDVFLGNDPFFYQDLKQFFGSDIRGTSCCRHEQQKHTPKRNTKTFLHVTIPPLALVHSLRPMR